MSDQPNALPYAFNGAPLRGQLRATPDDFIVEEVQAITPDGDGEHAWLWVRKRGVNTEWLAKAIARFAEVKPSDVSYAGLKDRHALTTQAFTVYLPGRPSPDWATMGIDGVEVLSASRHRRKLKRGALQGNRFEITLRAISGDHDAADAVLSHIAARGVPNYFGEQRFGFGGANVMRAERMFAGLRVDHATRSILLSAARSQLFNTVLAQRVRDHSWDQPLDGEIWALSGSHAWFGPEPLNEALRARLASADIHPSGPLWGRGALPSAEAVLALEQTALAPLTTLREGLERAGLNQDRRALRLIPQQLSHRWLDDDALQLCFRLPPGAYATVVLRELCSWDAP